MSASLALAWRLALLSLCTRSLWLTVLAGPGLNSAQLKLLQGLCKAGGFPGQTLTGRQEAEEVGLGARRLC